MAGKQTLVDTLKNNLKARGITYKKLASKWQLSEASVKRLMSEEDLTLSRIEQACELMNLSFAEFMKLVPFDVELTDQVMLPEHEAEFAKNLRMYHFFVLLNEGNTLKQIEKKYQITETEIQKFLFKLDHMGLLQLRAGNKFTLLSGNRVLLQKDGPMGKLLLEQVKTSFLEYPFKNTTQEHLRFVIHKLSPSSAIRYKAKIDKLINEMKVESDVEGSNSDSVEFGLLTALRPWDSPLARALKRREPKN